MTHRSGAVLAVLLLQGATQAAAQETSAQKDEFSETALAALTDFDAEAEAAPDDDLAAAIVETYESNPGLAALRYELRETDDALGLALAGTRAQVRAEVSAGYEFIEPGTITQAGRSPIDRLNTPNIRRNDLSAQIIVDQPLTTGGRARASELAARGDIRAGREALRGSEGDLLVDLITAYADVRRDTHALAIRRKNADVLAATLDEVAARREAGELTRTDIAQAQTQLQSARAQFNAAEAQVQQSRATFAAIVGREPRTLAALPVLPLLPATMDDAFDVAAQYNPDFAAAIESERASRARIAAARAERMPRLDLRGTAGATGPLSPFRRENEDLSYSGRATLTIPLTSGGRTSAQIAQALDRNSADRLRIEAARRRMVRGIVTAWNEMVVAGRNLDVGRLQLEAARTYYEGTYEEYRAGLRSTFDVLYAQNSLRDTQIALLSSRRDQYVAQATLLRQLGHLEVGKLLTGTGLYDPAAHVRTVEQRAALPWDPVLRMVDGLATPGQSQQRIEGVRRVAGPPKMVPAAPDPGQQELMTRSPIVPPPGTLAGPMREGRP